VKIILRLCAEWEVELGYETLLRVVMYSDSRDWWTTDEMMKLSIEVLSQRIHRENMSHFIMHSILDGFLKPLFRRAPVLPCQDTSSAGRFDSNMGTTTASLATWKRASPEVVTVYRWAIDHADVCTIFARVLCCDSASYNLRSPRP
jgi:hypothetical protein